MYPGRFRRDPYAGSAPQAPHAAFATFVAFVILALTAGCSSGSTPAVELGQVALATATEVVEAPATVVARATASVQVPAPGTVVELKVADGQRVSRGQILLRVDSPATRKALENARAADAQVAGSGTVSLPRLDLAGLERADATAAKAFAKARTAALAIPDTPLRTKSLAQVSAAEADHRAVQAQIRRAGAQMNSGLASLGRLASSLAQAQRAQTRAAVSAAQASVDALTVRTPISGTIVLGGVTSGASGGSAGDLASVLGQLSPGGIGGIGGVAGGSGSAAGGTAGATGGTAGGGGNATAALSVGTPVTAGTTLATITDISELSLTASLDETDVLLVKPGVPADVEIDAVPGATYPATVRSVDLQPTASPRGGVSYGVRLTLGAGRGSEAAAPDPRPGMSAVARLRVRTATDAVSVPAAAVFRDGPRDAVWVVENGTARRRPVVLGAQGDSVVQVTSGLEVGQPIVVRGADQVAEGQRVEPR